MQKLSPSPVFGGCDFLRYHTKMGNFFVCPCQFAPGSAHERASDTGIGEIRLESCVRRRAAARCLNCNFRQVGGFPTNFYTSDRAI